MFGRGGRNRWFAWWVTLCALGACSGTLHPPSESRPAERAPATETCTLAEEPSRTSDTAAIAFRFAGAGPFSAGRDACALRLIAEALRPWPTASNDRWTVQIALGDTGAIVHRLRAQSARDAIDAGVALIATEDLALVAYAAARPELEVTPLPWDRTYLRLAPGTGGPLGAAVSSDAVRIDARLAEPLSCDRVLPAPESRSVSARSARVIYPVGDPTARELAERVVALTGDRTAAAVGLDPGSLDAALRAGDELAYIMSVPRSAASGCSLVAMLALRAPWIAPHSVVSLIDTRAYAIAPRAPRP
jgi:hypothetical protein